MNGCNIEGSGFESLRDLKSLRNLWAIKSRVIDASLVHVKSLPALQMLDLKGTLVTDSGLEHLSGLVNLKTLFVTDTKITEAGCKKLQESLPHLKINR